VSTHPHVLEIDNVQQGYIDLCQHILLRGEPVAPRGERTVEIQSFTLIHNDPSKCVVDGIGRNAKLAIGAAEAAQLIAGVSMPELMLRVSPNFKNFMDGGRFYGAYGPRIAGQIRRAIAVLAEDPSSRRARVTIWNEDDLNTLGLHDYPCTLGFTFHIRNNKLSMHTHMRSNDAWWGFTYDIMQFCVLQMSVAAALDIGVDRYYHHVDSMHIYERDFAALDMLHTPSKPATELSAIGCFGGRWPTQVWAARHLLGGAIPRLATPTAQCFSKWLAPYTDEDVDA